jgi:hypothetical protein
MKVHAMRLLAAAALGLGVAASAAWVQAAPASKKESSEDDAAPPVKRAPAEKRLKPTDAPGFVAFKPGEHPRLFFRKSELPQIKARAATPQGQAIVKRLRVTLNGANGDTMPEQYNDTKGDTDGTRTDLKLPAGKGYTLWHAAGYGMLYQLTGEKKYADLGRQSVERAFSGTRDVDGRCAYVRPSGALRAGPSLSAIAMGYDLCYDGWDEDFRKKVALAIQTYDYDNQPAPGSSLVKLARGQRQSAGSNHWGPIVGGGSIALLAIKGDPGVDDKLISELLVDNEQCIITQLSEGWGPSGWYCQGDGAGCISSDNAFLPALKAWRVAAGKDFVTGNPTPQWMTLKWVMGSAKVDGKMVFPGRGMYPHNVWSRTHLSGGGAICQGFGALEEKYKPALLYFYNHSIREEDEKAGAPFDTVSVYPHRSIQALVNWPFDMQEKDPAEILGRISGLGSGYIFCRNQWKDETDLSVSLCAGPQYQITVYGHGMTLSFGKFPGATFTYQKDFPDGSLSVSNPKGGAYVAVDFTKKSGADLVLICVGKAAGGGKDIEGKTAKVKAHICTVHNEPCVIRVWHAGPAPAFKQDGDKFSVGAQTYTFDGAKITWE